MITTAAILARGLGTRMRRADSATQLNELQAAAADRGVKGMIPIAGVAATATPRPFLDYVLSDLADVGITHAVLVVGPEHGAVREYFARDNSLRRVQVTYAIQEQPLGTANAVVAAADVVGDDAFLVLNADNVYPREALERLVASATAATIAFDRETLVREGNIDRQRVGAFAVLELSSDGRLLGIIEKPDASLDLKSSAARWVGMNCWTITPDVVDACRRVPLSSRGEYELPEAVALAIRGGVEVRAICVALPVLDLSQRADIPAVVAHLAAIEPRP